MEMHYRLTPQNRFQLERVTDECVEAVPIPGFAYHWSPQLAWGYPGSGPKATAAALLTDAAGDLMPRGLELDRACQALVSDLLVHLDSAGEHVVGSRELRAWVNERLPAKLEISLARQGVVYEPEDLEELALEMLNQEPEHTWFDRHRAEHGHPETAQV